MSWKLVSECNQIIVKSKDAACHKLDNVFTKIDIVLGEEGVHAVSHPLHPTRAGWLSATSRRLKIGACSPQSHQ